MKRRLLTLFLCMFFIIPLTIVMTSCGSEKVYSVNISLVGEKEGITLHNSLNDTYSSGNSYYLNLSFEAGIDHKNAVIKSNGNVINAEPIEDDDVLKERSFIYKISGGDADVVVDVSNCDYVNVTFTLDSDLTKASKYKVNKGKIADDSFITSLNDTNLTQWTQVTNNKIVVPYGKDVYLQLDHYEDYLYVNYSNENEANQYLFNCLEYNGNVVYNDGLPVYFFNTTNLKDSSQLNVLVTNKQGNEEENFTFMWQANYNVAQIGIENGNNGTLVLTNKMFVPQNECLENNIEFNSPDTELLLTYDNTYVGIRAGFEEAYIYLGDDYSNDPYRNEWFKNDENRYVFSEIYWEIDATRLNYEHPEDLNYYVDFYLTDSKGETSVKLTPIKPVLDVNRWFLKLDKETVKDFIKTQTEDNKEYKIATCALNVSYKDSYLKEKFVGFNVTSNISTDYTVKIANDNSQTYYATSHTSYDHKNSQVSQYFYKSVLDKDDSMPNKKVVITFDLPSQNEMIYATRYKSVGVVIKDTSGKLVSSNTINLNDSKTYDIEIMSASEAKTLDFYFIELTFNKAEYVTHDNLKIDFSKLILKDDDEVYYYKTTGNKPSFDINDYTKITNENKDSLNITISSNEVIYFFINNSMTSLNLYYEKDDTIQYVGTGGNWMDMRYKDYHYNDNGVRYDLYNLVLFDGYYSSDNTFYIEIMTLN